MTGRPRLPNRIKRKNIVQFRLTDEELRQIEEAAKRCKVKLSQWLREIVLEMAKTYE
jgi:hypothetical protein